MYSYNHNPYDLAYPAQVTRIDQAQNPQYQQYMEPVQPQMNMGYPMDPASYTYPIPVEHIYPEYNVLHFWESDYSSSTYHQSGTLKQTNAGYSYFSDQHNVQRLPSSISWSRRDITWIGYKPHNQLCYLQFLTTDGKQFCCVLNIGLDRFYEKLDPSLIPLCFPMDGPVVSWIEDSIKREEVYAKKAYVPIEQNQNEVERIPTEVLYKQPINEYTSIPGLPRTQQVNEFAMIPETNCKQPTNDFEKIPEALRKHLELLKKQEAPSHPESQENFHYSPKFFGNTLIPVDFANHIEHKIPISRLIIQDVNGHELHTDATLIFSNYDVIVYVNRQLTMPSITMSAYMLENNDIAKARYGKLSETQVYFQILSRGADLRTVLNISLDVFKEQCAKLLYAKGKRLSKEQTEWAVSMMDDDIYGIKSLPRKVAKEEAQMESRPIITPKPVADNYVKQENIYGGSVRKDIPITDSLAKVETPIVAKQVEQKPVENVIGVESSFGGPDSPSTNVDLSEIQDSNETSNNWDHQDTEDSFSTLKPAKKKVFLVNKMHYQTLSNTETVHLEVKELESRILEYMLPSEQPYNKGCTICWGKCKGAEFFSERGWELLRDPGLDKTLQKFDMLTCANLIFSKFENQIRVMGIVILDGINATCIHCKDYKGVWKKELVHHCQKWHDCQSFDVKQLAKLQK